jgi:hypothetical protein
MSSSPAAPGHTTEAGTFTLTAPSGTTDVKQGETKEVKVTVNKKGDFKEDITFSTVVDPPGKGVTATPEKKTWMPSDPTVVMVKVTAADNAAEGTYHVRVIAKPAVGNETDKTFEVKVARKGK